MNAHHLQWDLHADCERPVYVSLWSRPERYDKPWVRASYTWEAGGYHKVPTASMLTCADTPDVMWLEIRARCRKCDACARWRGRQWTARAITETTRSQRTWFGTLTLNPSAVREFSRRAAERAPEPAASYTEAMARLHREVGEELTKYIKRVRKVSGAQLRYVLVQEAHKTGLPHYHMLIHEVVGSRPVLHRHVSQQWHHGFVKWNLIAAGEDAKAAVYACKYLNKAVGARVRASQRYGKAITALGHSLLEEEACIDVPGWETLDPLKENLVRACPHERSVFDGYQLPDEAKSVQPPALRLSAARGASYEPPCQRQSAPGSGASGCPGSAGGAASDPAPVCSPAVVVDGCSCRPSRRDYDDDDAARVSQQRVAPVVWAGSDPPGI